jgi:hypothetical protein
VDAIKEGDRSQSAESPHDLSTVFRDMGMIPEAEEEMAVSFQLQRGY